MFPLFPQTLTVATWASRASIVPYSTYKLNVYKNRGNIGNTEGIAETGSETDRKHRKHLGEFPAFFVPVGSAHLKPNPTKTTEDTPDACRCCLRLMLGVDLKRVIHKLPR